VKRMDAEENALHLMLFVVCSLEVVMTEPQSWSVLHAPSQT
jgi:hypothetical protein